MKDLHNEKFLLKFYKNIAIFMQLGFLNSLFRVVRSTAFLLFQRCSSSPSFSRSLDHPPSISILLGILYPGYFIDNSSLSGPYLSVFSVCFFARLFTQWHSFPR